MDDIIREIVKKPIETRHAHLKLLNTCVRLLESVYSLRIAHLHYPGYYYYLAS